MATTNPPTQFALRSRILHWLMAVMLLTMLFIGVTMVASLGNYHKLVAIHRPLGIMFLILAVIRLINRFFFQAEDGIRDRAQGALRAGPPDRDQRRRRRLR